MTENITYLIDAQDKASAKVRKSKEEVKKMVTEVKDLGGKSKASAELVGTLANQIGSTGAGAAAGEVAQLVERISAFSEVAKEGGKGAFFLKAGIAAATAVVAFKLGSALGDVIFQTEKWKRLNKEALEESATLTERNIRLQDKRLQQSIELARTLGEAGKEDKLEQLLSGAYDNAEATSKRLAKLKKELADLRGDNLTAKDLGLDKLAGPAGFALRDLEVGDLGINDAINARRIETVEQEIENEKRLLAAARGRAELLQDMQSPKTKALEAAKQQAAAEGRSREALKQITDQLALAKAQGDERLRLELKLGGVLDSQIESALRMRKEINAIAEAEKLATQAKAEAERKHQQQIAETERARKKAAADRAREEQRIAQAQASTVNNIKLQILEAAKGRQAADQLRFQQQGFAEDHAKRLARGIEQFRKLQQQAGQSSIPSQSLSAGADERLATGRAAASFRKTAEAVEAERQTKIQAEMLRALKSLERFEAERRRDQPQQLVVVGD